MKTTRLLLLTVFLASAAPAWSAPPEPVPRHGGRLLPGSSAVFEVVHDAAAGTLTLYVSKSSGDALEVARAPKYVSPSSGGTQEVALAAVPEVAGTWRVSDPVLKAKRLAGTLEVVTDSRRTRFRRPGRTAAGLFSLDGSLTAIAEDVGRHNAVDKIIGRHLLADALPLDRSMLFVSGRTSFELVQKALLAGIPLIAAVSAPSSLAIDLARDAGIPLCGFVRGEAFNIYAHPERVT